MNPATPDPDSRHFRQALGQFATGVTIITTAGTDGQPVGVTISTFSSLSLSPPLIMWSLVRQASAHAHFSQASRYVVHVLSAGHQDLALRFARGPQAERFLGLPLRSSPGGAPMLDIPDLAAWFDCSHHARHDGGDHDILVGRVEHCEHQVRPPLVHHAGRFLLASDLVLADPG